MRLMKKCQFLLGAPRKKAYLGIEHMLVQRNMVGIIKQQI